MDDTAGGLSDAVRERTMCRTMKHVLSSSAMLRLVFCAVVAVLLIACGGASPATVELSPTAEPKTVVRIPNIELPGPSPTTTPVPLPSGSEAASSPAAELLPAMRPLPPIDLAFSGERAYRHLSTYMQFQPRNTGSPGWRRAGDYIIEQMKAAGWQVEEQPFEYKGVTGRNIIAKRGTGPVLIIGAHYDGRKYADKDPDPAKQRDPMPGANDGGSGVAVLLELAGHIDVDRLGREVWLTFFDAEDNGNLEGWEYAVGSAHMVQHLEVRPEAMILLDLIGDADLNIFYEYNSTPELSRSIWRTAAELGYSQFVPEFKYAIIDDHTAFLNAGIPAVDVIDFDYPYWDTTNDTLDKVSAESLEVVGRTIERWLETRERP